MGGPRCHFCGRRPNDPGNPGEAVTYLELVPSTAMVPFERWQCGERLCTWTPLDEPVEGRRWRLVDWFNGVPVVTRSDADWRTNPSGQAMALK